MQYFLAILMTCALVLPAAAQQGQWTSDDLDLDRPFGDIASARRTGVKGISGFSLIISPLRNGLKSARDAQSLAAIGVSPSGRAISADKWSRLRTARPISFLPRKLREPD
jgi:hypothetical protein